MSKALRVVVAVIAALLLVSAVPAPQAHHDPVPQQMADPDMPEGG